MLSSRAKVSGRRVTAAGLGPWVGTATLWVQAAAGDADMCVMTLWAAKTSPFLVDYEAEFTTLVPLWRLLLPPCWARRLQSQGIGLVAGARINWRCWGQAAYMWLMLPQLKHAGASEVVVVKPSAAKYEAQSSVSTLTSTAFALT